jgi:hypothetical protein
MVDINHTKEMLDSPNLSDQEVEEIGDIARMLAELSFDAWEEERKPEPLTKENNEK